MYHNVYASLDYYGGEHCVHSAKAPIQPDFPGHHLRGSRRAPGEVYFTLCTGQAAPLITAAAAAVSQVQRNREERILEQKLPLKSGVSVSLKEQRVVLLRG